MTGEEEINTPFGPCPHTRKDILIQWGLSGGYWERQVCADCGMTFDLPNWVDAERKVFAVETAT